MKYRPFVVTAVVMIFCALITSYIYTQHNIRCAFSAVFGDNATVVIDAGHGGEDGGAQGPGGIMEKGINLNISNMTSDLLGFYGINTSLTRTQDISLHSEDFRKFGRRKTSDIKNRVKIINKFKDAVLISIHLNSYPNQSCRGAQVFYSDNNPMGRTLAETLQNTLKEGINDGNKRLAKKSGADIYLLKNVECPAVLVECGFLSNYAEANLLLTDAYQRKIAACIASGYIRFLNTANPMENSSVTSADSVSPVFPHD